MIEKIKKLINAVLQSKIKTITDHEYFNWLSFANAGMLDRGNIYAMSHAIKNLPSASPIVEIGSFCGLSINTISHLLSQQGLKNRIITCDKWLFEKDPSYGDKVGDSSISHQQYREFVKSTFMRNVEFFSKDNKPYTIEEISDDFFALWEKSEIVYDVFGREIKLGGKISFCYIDGNHTYDFAKRDFDNTDKYLDIGGFILFDDSSDVCSFGLTRLMKEVKNNKKYTLIMKNPNYLFKKIA